MRFLPGSYVAYDLQKHCWAALGYIYKPRPPNGTPEAVRKRSRPVLQEEMRAAHHAGNFLHSADQRPSPVGLISLTVPRWESAGQTNPSSLPSIYEGSFRFGNIGR